MRPDTNGTLSTLPCQRLNASVRRQRTLAPFSRTTRLFAPAVVVLIAAGCGAGSPELGQVSKASAATPVIVAQSLPGSLNARVVAAPPLTGGQPLLAALHRASGHGYLPSKRKQPKNILYVTDQNTGQVLLYNANKHRPQPIGELVDNLLCPVGITVDGTGTVYVADACANSPSGSVVVYPAGQTSPSRIITDGLNTPVGVAVDSEGDVFVSNIGTNTANIVAYAAGQSTPYETIGQSAFGTNAQPVGLAVDGSDNLWVASDANSTVYEIPTGSSQPQNAGLTELAGPIGLAFDAKGDLAVSNFVNEENDVAFYASGSTTPFESITGGMDAPTGVTITASGKLWAVDAGSTQGYQPNQNPPSSFIEVGGQEGLAVTPAALPPKKR
jgi:sugar lactone lactonase YvrE